jgi:ligand-binding sensor domain-containing protein
VQLTGRDEFVLHGPGSGLPADNVLALAVVPAGVWAGTDRGLVLLDERPAPSGFGGAGIPIGALSYSRDTLWVGTPRGLAFLAGPQGDLTSAFVDASLGPEVEAELRRAVRAVAAWGDTLVVAGEEALLWRAGRRWTVERPIALELGRLTALVPGEGGVWVGGEQGFGFLGFAGRSFTAYRAPDDVPGAVRDLGLTSEYLWVATENGLVRFSLNAIAP